METSIAQGLLVAVLEAGDVLLFRAPDEVSCLGLSPQPLGRKERRGYGVLRTAGLVPFRAAGARTVLSLSRHGGSVSRLGIGEGQEWQVEAGSLLAAAGRLTFAAGRRGFYPRGAGRLVRVSGSGEVWLATGRSPGVRVTVESGVRNRFEARCVVAFSDRLDSTSTLESLGHTSVSFAGDARGGNVLVSPERQA